jgi:hypothetical protein
MGIDYIARLKCVEAKERRLAQPSAERRPGNLITPDEKSD